MELNSNQIQEINPHRYPFALVDRITDYKPGEYAKGIKCVSVNEMHFCGHFPSHHVMPGVLIVEALAQVGCIAILSKEENKLVKNPAWGHIINEQKIRLIKDKKTEKILLDHFFRHCLICYKSFYQNSLW